MYCDYPEYGFGLVVTENDPIMEQLYDIFDDDTDGRVRYLDGEKGGRRFIPAGRDKSLAAEDMGMLVFYADKQPDAYKAAYESEEDVIMEFRKRLGGYLPEDFDYGAHIGYFHCCVYC